MFDIYDNLMCVGACETFLINGVMSEIEGIAENLYFARKQTLVV